MTPAEKDARERAKMKKPRSNPGTTAERWATEQASWDESHIQPTVEYIKEGLDPETTLTRVEEDLDGYQQQWRTQHADELAEYGVRTNAAINGIFEIYKDEYLHLAERRMDHIAPKRNPGTSEDRDAGIETYKAFHRYDPIDIGDFDDDFTIPKTMLLGGKGICVTYRSAKVDPSTLKKPRNPVNYIHTFDAGVQIYVSTDSDLEAAGLDEVDVPAEYRRVQTLVMLGQNLGYDFELDGEKVVAEANDPLPELYCTPDGTCLLVIQDKREVLAMIWGGALGVYPRGIDG